MSDRRTYLLFAFTIFLSAFLLFVIQPIAGKHLLPWFGGTSAVWTTSMLFFTGVLFLGYLYTWYICKLPKHIQAWIHLTVVTFGAVFVALSHFAWEAIFPSLYPLVVNSAPAELKTLLALVLGIGIPYFILSTTSPLLQYWYGVSENKEPYSLYAISNTGSFLALALFPFVIERFSGLFVQEEVWSALFVLFALSYGWLSWRATSTQDTNIIRGDAAPISWRQKLTWVALAAFPSAMLIATTTQLTHVVAPIPLLWIVPLALYLITFIIAFAGYRMGKTLPIFILIAALFSWYYLDPSPYDIVINMTSFLSLFFFVCLLCHSLLYQKRPDTNNSALYYLFVSFGGMFGVLLVGIVAPLIFTDYWEFSIGILLSGYLSVYTLQAYFLTDVISGYRKKIILCGTAVVLCAIGFSYIHDLNRGYLYVSRNFYGTVRVKDINGIRVIMNGNTVHGLQFADPKLALMPAAYYVPDGGFGRSIMNARLLNKDHAISVGVIGLGAGMTAAYCTPGDTFVYYEIDQRVVDVAKNKFSYLAHCPQAQIQIGDGRILLQHEKDADALGKFDLLAVDAFNGDTIPVHLLTEEAIALFISHLKDTHSVLAIHITNRYLSLLPVLQLAARDLHLSLLDVTIHAPPNEVATESLWVLLSPGTDTFDTRIFKNASSTLGVATIAPWTDDHTDIFSVLYLPLRLPQFISVLATDLENVRPRF